MKNYILFFNLNLNPTFKALIHFYPLKKCYIFIILFLLEKKIINNHKKVWKNDNFKVQFFYHPKLQVLESWIWNIRFGFLVQFP